MIERNLCNVERVLRLVFGLLFAAWAISQPFLNGVEWFVIVISIALMLRQLDQNLGLFPAFPYRIGIGLNK